MFSTNEIVELGSSAVNLRGKSGDVEGGFTTKSLFYMLTTKEARLFEINVVIILLKFLNYTIKFKDIFPLRTHNLYLLFGFYMSLSITPEYF